MHVFAFECAPVRDVLVFVFERAFVPSLTILAYML